MNIDVHVVYQRLRASLSFEQLDKLYKKIGFYLQDVGVEEEEKAKNAIEKQN